MKQLTFIEQTKRIGKVFRHTMKKYQLGGSYYYIDKIHDGVGGIYQLLGEPDETGHQNYITVFGERYFGEKIRWSRVEKIVAKRLNGIKVMVKVAKQYDKKVLEADQ